MWEIEGRYRGDMYGEREDIERKMREAYECGYEDARREMRGSYGERHTGGYMPDAYAAGSMAATNTENGVAEAPIRDDTCAGKSNRRGEKSPLFNCTEIWTEKD